MLWRDRQLQAITSDLQHQTLYTHDDDRAVLSRILLLEHGTILFGLHDELLIVGNTSLAQLDNGPWPCGDGNLLGNPVLP